MKKLNRRILSALLAFLLFLSNFPAVSAAKDDFAITYEGKTVKQVEFYEYEKITVSVEGIPEGSSCQWQIQIPGTEQWVDIHGQTAEELGLSKAVVGSLMVDGSAYVRCAATGDAETNYTDALQVTVKETEFTQQENVIAAPVETAPKATEAPVEETTKATEAPVEETTEATEIPTEVPVEETTEATEAPTEVPVEETTEATETPTEAPAESSTEPAEIPAAPAVIPSAPVEISTEPEEISVETEQTPTGPVEISEQTLVNNVMNALAPRAAADEGETSENPPVLDDNEIVTITINYVYWDRQTNQPGSTTWDPYIASVQKGTSFVTERPIANKIVPGYKTTWGKNGDTDALPPAGATLVNQSGAPYNPETDVSSYVKINLQNVTSDVEYTVYYEEVMVPYHARYFLQNIYNDLYTEDNSYYLAFQGYQNTEPNTNDIYIDIYGFTPLFHQPDTIAADGSTVFEVYCDRNYYLINFNMDGGFGTAPVYARYGTAFSVSLPTKPGHSFDGWQEDLNKRDINTNGSDQRDETYIAARDNCIAGIPLTQGRVTKIPFTNMTYTAKWNAENTSYTVAYWILGANGTSKTYLGSRTDYAPSDTPVSGKDDIKTADVCGKEEHTHMEECLSCKSSEHTHHSAHTRTCYKYVTSWGGEVSATSEDGHVIANANTIHADTNGTYIYVIWTTSNSALWPKILIDGKYYTVNIDGAQTISRERLAEITEGNLLASGSYGAYRTEKYLLSPDCDLQVCGVGCAITEHTHDDRCYSCGLSEHTHDGCISKSANYLTYLDTQTDKNVVVKGDGSTVVNVVYSEKLYTLRFYYARSKMENGNPVYSVVGGSTNYFGALGDYSQKTVEQLLANVPNDQWGDVQALPTINENYKDKYVTGSISPTNSAYTYYYLEFTAQFGSQLKDIWPVAIFNPVKVSTRTSQCPDLEYAYFSAWNGEYKVKYTQDHRSSGGGSSGNKNETIKGLYMYLDENIVFDKNFTEIAHTDTNGNATYLVNFLGFWDNGATNIHWSIPKAFNYHILIPTTDTTEVVGKEYKEHNGVKYEVNKEFVVYDNSDLEVTANQTAVAIEGYNHVATVVENANYSEDHANGKLQSVDYYFFYTTNGPYILNFWNHSQYMESGDGEPFYYGASLSKFQRSDNNEFMTKGYEYQGKKYGPYYPPTLEPDAYHFEGWYTTSECIDGTRVNWETMTMPNSNLTVYAKWEPVTYTTYFYLDYEHYRDRWASENQLDTTKVYRSVSETKHGEKMDLTGILNDILYPQNGDYRFNGWFYYDTDGTKKAFNPSEMAVRKELHLFAEWTSSVTKEYTVHYYMGDENGNIIYADENGKTNPIKLADVTTGRAFESTTKTFKAKPKDQLNLLSTAPGADPDKLWLPNTNSHSIVMNADNSQNEYAFVYMAKENAPYVVRYVDSATGREVHEQKDVEQNDKGFVTEKFVYVPGYIPESFYKTLVLSANNEENVIVFFYSKDEDANEDENGELEGVNSLYYVVHYAQDADDPDVYHEVNTETIKAKIGTTVKAVPFSNLTSAGYEVDYNNAGTVSEGEVTTDGLELKLYYIRTKYGYEVIYKEYGTDKKIAPTKEVGKTDATAKERVPFGKIIEEEAIAIKGYDLYSSKTQSLKISTDVTKNVITFEYVPKPLTINYIPSCTDTDLFGFGKVTKSREENTQIGSQAIPSSGFKFDGWYKSDTFTAENRISDDQYLNVSEYVDPSNPPASYEYNFYALFEPITLTISQSNMAATDSAIYEVVQGTNTVARVMLTGTDSVTLYAIPAGNYTIQEISGNWTWNYANTQSQANVEVNATATNPTVSFDYQGTYVASCWLHNEARNP